MTERGADLDRGCVRDHADAVGLHLPRHRGVAISAAGAAVAEPVQLAGSELPAQVAQPQFLVPLVVEDAGGRHSGDDRVGVEQRERLSAEDVEDGAVPCEIDVAVQVAARIRQHDGTESAGTLWGGLDAGEQPDTAVDVDELAG
ncbi:MAG: hypothetical protein NTV97_31285 [Alphaproteobacteria bacterium]|nr:hypothetical protein [Alphaproteobacteria bacterium]